MTTENYRTEQPKVLLVDDSELVLRHPESITLLNLSRLLTVLNV
jgi:hypothetical protein